jgi:predicted lipoprotein with Yx(FWY)xxD motif
MRMTFGKESLTAGLLALSLLVAAGCGGSSGGASGGSSAASITVTARKVPGFGTVLATQAGKPLYLLSSDPSGGSKCVDACAKEWPPLTGDGKAAEGVKDSLLSSFKRSDGTTQVLYDGHALYTYTGDGLVSGVGTKALGGTWSLISPAGKTIDTTAVGGY